VEPGNGVGHLLVLGVGVGGDSLPVLVAQFVGRLGLGLVEGDVEVLDGGEGEVLDYGNRLALDINELGQLGLLPLEREVLGVAGGGVVAPEHGSDVLPGGLVEQVAPSEVGSLGYARTVRVRGAVEAWLVKNRLSLSAHCRLPLALGHFRCLHQLALATLLHSVYFRNRNISHLSSLPNYRLVVPHWRSTRIRCYRPLSHVL